MIAALPPKGWAIDSLGAVADIERNGIAADDIVSGTTYVGLENITGAGRFQGVATVQVGELKSTKFRFKADHILFGKLRPYLAKIALPNFEGVCSTDILPIRAKAILDKGYLLHYLRQPRMIDLARRRSTGANLPRLSPRALGEFPVAFPTDIGEQKRIAAILDKADAVRRERQQAIALTEDLLRSTFLDMFGDPKKNRNGYKVRPLRELVRPGDKINYGIVQPGPHVEDGVPIVRVGDFEAYSIGIAALKRVSPTVEEAYVRSRLIGDEVLVACVGSIGAIALADGGLEGMNIVRAVARIRCSDEINRAYLGCYLLTSFVQSFFRKETRTVAQPTLNIRQIEETPVAVPPLVAQERFAEFFSKARGLAANFERSAHCAESLFASLSQRAFRGDL